MFWWPFCSQKQSVCVIVARTEWLLIFHFVKSFTCNKFGRDHHMVQEYLRPSGKAWLNNLFRTFSRLRGPFRDFFPDSLSQMALQRCNVNLFARFLEGECWEVNFLRVNFWGLFCWKNRLNKNRPKNSGSKYGPSNSKIHFPEFGPKFRWRRCKDPCAAICP